MSNTSILANSIWPNGMQVVDGYAVFTPLGKNKTVIPTNSSQWPKGNKLVSPFVYQDDKLVGFCDTKAMEVGNATTIVMPYEHIEAEFSSIDKGQLQIHAPNATFKKASWKNGDMDVIPEAQYKYKGCKTVDDVKAVDSNYQTTDIVDGTWSELLCDLEDSDSMFYDCSNLTSFTSDLSSLTNGVNMFGNCKLDTASVKNIAETINTVTNKPKIHIGIDNSTPSTEEDNYLTQIHNKGWNVYVNGSFNAYVPATASLDETGETQTSPIPFWAKPEPATEESAKYVDENGNFFNILGGQFIYVDDPDTYGMFTCEADAAANMRLTHYIKPIENQ